MERNKLKHNAHSVWRCQHHLMFAARQYTEKYEQISEWSSEKTVQRKESKNNWGKGMSRSYTHACQHACTFECSIVYRVSQKVRWWFLIVTQTSNIMYGNRHLWYRGYYVDTADKNNKIITKYIRNQLMENEMYNQMTVKEDMDLFTGGKNNIT